MKTLFLAVSAIVISSFVVLAAATPSLAGPSYIHQDYAQYGFAEINDISPGSWLAGETNNHRAAAAKIGALGEQPSVFTTAAGLEATEVNDISQAVIKTNSTATPFRLWNIQNGTTIPINLPEGLTSGSGEVVDLNDAGSLLFFQYATTSSWYGKRINATWTWTDLKDLGNQVGDGYAVDLNNADVVATRLHGQPAIWKKGVGSTTVTSPSGAQVSGLATAINDLGTVVGVINVTQQSHDVFTWSAQSPLKVLDGDLEPQPGNLMPLSISSKNVLVGQTQPMNIANVTTFNLVTKERMAIVGAPCGAKSVKGISNLGHIGEANGICRKLVP